MKLTPIFSTYIPRWPTIQIFFKIEAAMDLPWIPENFSHVQRDPSNASLVARQRVEKPREITSL